MDTLRCWIEHNAVLTSFTLLIFGFKLYYFIFGHKVFHADVYHAVFYISVKSYRSGSIAIRISKLNIVFIQ